MENDMIMPFDFLLMLLGIAALFTVVVIGVYILKRRRLRRLTCPHKDYHYRSPGYGEPSRAYRIDKIEE